MRVPATARFAAVFAALVTSIACGSTPTEPTAPPAPVYELKTSTFTGKVATGGSAGFPFTVVNPGDISLSITELAPSARSRWVWPWDPGMPPRRPALSS